MTQPLRGKSLVLKLDEVDYHVDIKELTLDPQEGNPSAGDLYHTIWMMTGTARTRLEPDSIYEFVMANSGQQVEFEMGVAGANGPVATGVVEIGRKPAVQYVANDWVNFEFEWEVVGDFEFDYPES